MTKFSFAALLGVVTICSSTAALATEEHSDHDHSSHENHRGAPAGIMGDHVHNQGEWMVSYRYNRMGMKGSRDGTSSLKPAEVLNDFAITPTEMDMEMHMFGLMYGATENLTLMAMAPYVKKSMKHVNRMGTQFTTRSKGIGDTKLGGIYKFYEGVQDGATNTALLNFGLSLPTGSITERDNTPLGNQRLPYPMQLGSGTVDPKLGLTLTSHLETWQLGAQGSGTFRFGDNSEGYRLGNEVNVTAWAARPLDDWISASVRLDGNHIGNIRGSDANLNPAIIPTARTDLRGGTRVDALIGVNLYQNQGVLKGQRLAVEFGMPVYQHLDGPQLETDYRMTIGWQKEF